MTDQSKPSFTKKASNLSPTGRGVHYATARERRSPSAPDTRSSAPAWTSQLQSRARGGTYVSSVARAMVNRAGFSSIAMVNMDSRSSLVVTLCSSTSPSFAAAPFTAATCDEANDGNAVSDSGGAITGVSPAEHVENTREIAWNMSWLSSASVTRRGREYRPRQSCRPRRTCRTRSRGRCRAVVGRSRPCWYALVEPLRSSCPGVRISVVHEGDGGTYDEHIDRERLLHRLEHRLTLLGCDCVSSVAQEAIDVPWNSPKTGSAFR